jgi:hypothetical protein
MSTGGAKGELLKAPSIVLRLFAAVVMPREVKRARRAF